MSDDTPQKKDPFDGARDENGRFAPGNPGGPGKTPGNRTIREALNILLHRPVSEAKEVLDDEEARSADRLAAQRILTALTGTEQGSAKAFEQISDRVEGKPHQSHEVRSVLMTDPADLIREIEESLGVRPDGSVEGDDSEDE